MDNPSPLRYPGGKHKTYKYIKKLILENKSSTYIEPFAGGAAVAINLLLEGIVNKIIINDFDRAIYALWFSILNYPDQLIKLIVDTEISIEEWNIQKEVQKNKDFASLLSLGFSTLYLNRTNRSGIIKGGVIGGKEQKGNYLIDCRFPKEKLINKIHNIYNLRDQIELYNLDALLFIDNVIKRTRNSFIFFDPPYYKQGPALYTNFYNDKDHRILAKKIKKDLRNRKWIVTYDNSSEIKKMYEGLNVIEYYLNYSVQDKKRGIEYMFFSNKVETNNPENYLRVISNPDSIKILSS